MSTIELYALLPLISLAATPVVVLAAIAVSRDHLIAMVVTLIGLGVSSACLCLVGPLVPAQITPLVIMDGYALFFVGLILAATAAVVLLSYQYLERRGGHHEEYYALLLFAALGACVVVSSNHFASFFVGLETLGVSLYALIAYLRAAPRGIEAGIKYLILAATADAILLFGMALIYAKSGALEFSETAASLAGDYSGVQVAGLALLVSGIGFKLSLVPFHMWTPDVYEGAPAPITGFLATVSKGAVFALLLRYFGEVPAQDFSSVALCFSAIALASMLAGNLLALLQDNVKRMLAYSSIAHLGYLLVAFLAERELAVTAVAYYLVAYFLSILGAFGVVGILSQSEEEADRIEDYQGLVWRRPWLGAAFTIMLLSLAGIPLTAGFVGKFYVLAAGVDSSLWLLVLVLIGASVIGLFYYLRLIAAMFRSPETPRERLRERPVGFAATAVVLGALTVLVVWLGLYPSPLIDLIQRSAALSGF
jgi:NADH-quinone oxidoreductase subunit N